MAYNFQKVKIGQWELTKYPKGTSLHFHSQEEGNLEDIQQDILNNLWNSRNSTDKVRNLNILAFYFSNLPKQSFSYYVVVKGKIPGIYSKWISVIEQINHFHNPLWKAFHSIHEALEFARHNIGTTFYVDPKASMDSMRAPVYQNTDAPSSSRNYQYALEKDNTNRIEFCRHCKSMEQAIRSLNLKCRNFEEEDFSQKEKIKSLTEQLKEMYKISGSQGDTILSQISEIGELKGRLSHTASQMASSSSGPIKQTIFIKEKPISERPFEFLKPRISFKPYHLLNFLPLHIQEIISQKAQAQYYSKLMAVQQYFYEIAKDPIRNTAAIRLHPSFFINPEKHCPNNPEACDHQKINSHCIHTLSHFFLRATIILSKYSSPKILRVNGERVILTPQFLMDAGFLEKIIVTNPEDTHCLGTHLGYFIRKMLDYGQWATVHIKSAPAEWIGLFDIEPAIHRMMITVSNIPPARRTTEELEKISSSLVECPLELKEQLINAKMIQLAYRHFIDQWENGIRLVYENKIQKIYVPYRFKLEKDFTISTNYPEVFEKYLEGYYMSTGARHLDIEADEEYNDDHYWETMGPEEMSNIENMMEG